MLADFSTSDVTGIITAIVSGTLLIIGAVAAAIVQVRNGQQRAAAAQVSNDHKLDEIHQLTNSNLTAVKTELAAAKLEISELRALFEAVAVKRPGGPVTEPALIVTPLP